MWENVLWSDETNVKLIYVCLAQIQHCTSSEEHHTHSEARWEQHHALGLFLFSWNWGLSQGGGNYEQFQIPVNVGTKPSAVF